MCSVRYEADDCDGDLQGGGCKRPTFLDGRPTQQDELRLDTAAGSDRLGRTFSDLRAARPGRPIIDEATCIAHLP